MKLNSKQYSKLYTTLTFISGQRMLQNSSSSLVHKTQLDVDLAVNGLSSVTNLLRFALTALRYALRGGGKA